LTFPSRTKITVGVPTRESVPIQVVVSFLNLIKPEYYFLSNNYIPLDKSRNDIAAKFLCLHPDSEYLLFWDSDIIAPRNALVKLMRHKVPIVGALYFQKYPPFFPVAGCRIKREKTKAVHLLVQWREGETFPVDALGMGFTLIRRDVFQKIKYPWFRFTELSEDFEFCYSAQKAGFEVLVDTSIICQHKSDTVFIDRQMFSLFQQQLRQTALTLEGKLVTTLPILRHQRV